MKVFYHDYKALAALINMFRALVDSIFPPSKEAVLVRTLTEADVAVCYHHKIVDRGVHVLSDFKNESVAALIHEAKFHHSAKAQFLLSHLLVQFLQGAYTPDATLTMIPIPLSKKRFRARGYNQVEKILGYALRTEPRELLLCTDALKRVKDTAPQTSLGRAERLKNMAGAFEVVKPEQVTGAHILLIDDVHTTGATLNAAALALLRKAPSSLTAVALAG